MKGNRYISFALLLLFLFAVGSRQAATFLCSCDSHHHEVEHLCCHCEEHASNCNNHNEVMKESCCNFHFNSVSLFADADSKVNRLSYSHYTDLLSACTFAFSCQDNRLHSESYDFNPYHFIVVEWCGLSASLRAPPVLV